MLSVANVHGKSLLMGDGQAGYKEHISEELSVQPGISPHLCYVRHTSCYFRKKLHILYMLYSRHFHMLYVHYFI